MFGKGVTAALSSNTADEIDRSTNKRRKVEKEDEEDLPPHCRAVKSFHELVRLMRAYYGGRGRVTSMLPVGIEARGVDEWDDEAGGMEAPRFTDYLDAQRQFSNASFVKRAEVNRMYAPQATIAKYLSQTAGGKALFNPDPAIRGLIREFACGPGGFIHTKANELMRYFLPCELPTIDEVRHKLECVLNATGMYKDFSGMTMDEMIATGSELGEDLFSDPHEYSEITVTEDDMENGEIGRSAYERIIRNNYYITTTLKHRNQFRFQHLSAQKDAVGMRRLMAQLANDMKLMYSGKDTKGIPKVYGRLYKESHRLLVQIRTEGKDTEKYVKRARAIFYARKKDHEFTGLSWMFVRDAKNVAFCMKFMVQQQTMYMLLYNFHFAVTLNTNEVSSLIILAGPSETGKSFAIKKLTEAIAAALSRTEDSASEQAGTVDDSGDLQVCSPRSASGSA